MSERVHCCVPFCRRTTRKPYREWICGIHWRLVSSRTKQRRRAAVKIARRSNERFDDAYSAQGYFEESQYQRVLAARHLSEALWERCKSEAIERAGGL